MERVWVRDRVLAGRRLVIRATEWLLWDVCYWMYRRATGIAVTGQRDGNTQTTTASSSSSQPSAVAPTQGETSASSRGGGGDPSCRSEVCRYCRAMEKTLLWQDFTFFINLYLIIALNVTFWFYSLLGIPESQVPFRIVTVYSINQLLVAFRFMDTLAPAVECQRVCSKFHWLWRSLRKLRSEKPGLHCIVLCLVAFGLWLLGHINPSTSHSIYWGIVLASLVLRLPLKLSDKISEYFMSHREWQCDSEIEDEFLPVVTEANLQVLNRVGETGDHSPTPTSGLSDTQNDSFYDEDFIEGLQEIAFNMPYHGEGSTDGVELSELELSVGENDAEEDGIKFKASHFDKSSSSSSSEEVFDGKKIAAAVSSDESNNGDSDFEIIDKEEIAKIEM
ncbi:PREDICTED: uncharacterized protein LOC105454527 [Wasmannia auropunctata]|uniref:uncharacterized protein LOC105454527 n=1 Tax=Wasmannia auropunctata TaxID=64793 RepID=UPI0005EFEA49|nr:PREDICTED: uncharacterized protein LOC105454527 [Wasmannia auropunctata]